MTPDQLFEELRSATSVEKRQSIVENGLKSGISPTEVTEMLDYIEYCASVKQTTKSVDVAVVIKKPLTFRSIWHSLACPFRLR